MKRNYIHIIILLLLTACMNDDLLTETNRIKIIEGMEVADYVTRQRGVFVINQGNFMYDNATLSYYFIDSAKVLNQVFQRINGIPLGDVAQSMQIRNELGYIVVNNSGKIYAIDIDNFEFRGKITGLVSPRYLHFVSDTKAYVTDLYAKAITIINPVTLQITGQIDVNNRFSLNYQHPTEQMVQYGTKLFVNCWSYDDKILVIDTQTDKVIDSLQVTKQPSCMVLDANEKLWVLSDGGIEGSHFGFERPALTRINPKNLEIERIFRFSQGDAPRSLALNGAGDTLYFINHHVWKMPVTTAQLPVEPFIMSRYEKTITGGFYTLAIDPKTSEVYVADAVDNVQQGIVYRFTPKASPIDTFKAGIVPGAFCFRP